MSSRVTENFIGFYTIVEKEIMRLVRIWVETLFPPIITSALYFTIFGNILGQHIGKIDGYSYIEFLTPGLVMLGVVNNAYSNVAMSFYMTKFMHTIDEMLVSPLPNFLIVLGYVIGGMFRGLIIGSLIFLTAMFFTPIHIAHPWFMLLIALLSAMLFSCAGFINGMIADSFDSISIIPTFVLTPLTYLGGVFFAVSALPHAWQVLARFNPILYIIESFRYSMLNIRQANIELAFAMIVLFVVVLFGVCLYMFNKGIGVKS